MGTKKRKDFDKDPKEEIRGEIDVLRFRRGSRLDYASRGRYSSYSGFSLHLFADFWVKMVERAKGLFRQKNALNPTFITWATGNFAYAKVG